VLVALVIAAVFIATMSHSWVEARCTRATMEGKPLRVANYGSLMYAAGLLVFVVAVKISLWVAVPPELAGVWLGGFLGTRRS
jgi:hypothetical protein